MTPNQSRQPTPGERLGCVRRPWPGVAALSLGRMSYTPGTYVRPGFVLSLLLALGVLALAALVIPSHARKGRSVIVRVGNNVSQIEVAKEIWAREHGATGLVSISEQDLAPYLAGGGGRTGFVSAIVGERYLINKLGLPAEAQLTRDLNRFPKGTIIRLSATNMLRYEILPPNNLMQPRR